MSDPAALPLRTVLKPFMAGHLDVLFGDVATARPVEAVTTCDSTGPADENALVLGIGLDGAALIAAIERCAGASALVVRRTATLPEALVDQLAGGQLVVLGLAPDADWLQLGEALTRQLREFRYGRSTAPLTSGDELDLFAVANSLASLLDGHVTIEDTTSRILAYSGNQDLADEPRKESILGGKVSRSINEQLLRDGTLRAIAGARAPLMVVSEVPGAKPRAVMPVRAGGQTLGSIWVIVDGPLSAVQERGLLEGADVVALSLMRRQLSADTDLRLRTETVAALLGGSAEAVAAASRNDLDDRWCAVLATEDVGAGPDEARATATTLGRTLGSVLATVAPRAQTAAIGTTTYTVLPVRGQDAGSAVVELHRLLALLYRHVPRNVVLHIGAGDPVSHPSDLDRSRQQADQALRVARRAGPSGARTVAWQDVQTQVLVAEMADLMAARREVVGAPLRAVLEADERGGAEMAPTLTAWLEHFGDVNAAAATVHVHANTFRYRLRKIQGLPGVDLDDPEVRFALLLQLRLHTRLTERSAAEH